MHVVVTVFVFFTLVKLATVMSIHVPLYYDVMLALYHVFNGREKNREGLHGRFGDVMMMYLPHHFYRSL